MRNRTVAILFAAALSVVAVAAGCSSTQKDQALATDIRARMFSDPQVKASSVNVAVKDGEVTLTGEVPDIDVRYQAYKLASDTAGVKHVVDHLTVQATQAPVIAEPTPPVQAPGSQPPEPVRKSTEHHQSSTRKTSRTISNGKTMSAEHEPAPSPVSEHVTPMQPSQPEAAVANPQPPQPPPPPQPKHVEIPAGTPVRVQMVDSVDSSVNHAGEIFRATLASPIVVDDQIVVPSGTGMDVKLVDASSAGHMTGQSELALELVRMEFQGKSYALVTNNYKQTGSSRSKRTAETVGGGAVLGAVLGAVIGHGKGAAIGAATGAGAGTVAQGATKGQQVQIPSETKLDFALQQSVEVSYFPSRNRASRQQSSRDADARDQHDQ